MKKDCSTMINALVVDDNEVNTIILANMLEVFGIHTDYVNNGMEAVLMAGKSSYQIIFVDHIMPEMNGIQTTTAIRNISMNQKDLVIIALTSTVSEYMRKVYLEAGANDVYEKPLGLPEIIKILKHWCPDAKMDMLQLAKSKPSSEKTANSVKAMIETIKEIDYPTGLRYAMGNPAHFINILEVSLKDLQSCINIIVNSQENNSIEQMRIGVHNLKSIFSNIGAIELSEKASLFESIILQGDFHKINMKCFSFLKHLQYFKDKLKSALEKYKSVMQSEKNIEQDYIPMSNEEYEQCLHSTIYYIRRYEYDSIIKGIEKLILQGPSELKSDFELALMEMKEYKYEKTLNRLLKYKNEPGTNPASDYKTY